MKRATLLILLTGSTLGSRGAFAFCAGGAGARGISVGGGPASKAPTKRKRSGAGSTSLRWHPADKVPVVAEIEERSGEDDDEEEFTTPLSHAQQWRKLRIKTLLERPSLMATEINEVMAPDHLEKHRFALNPVAAIGTIFQLDMLCDVDEGLVASVWSDVAAELGEEPPSLAEVRTSMGTRIPEDAVTQVFGWNQQQWEARETMLRFWDLMDDPKYLKAYEPRKSLGCQQWLEALKEHDVACSLVSRLPRAIVEHVIRALDFDQFFPRHHIVSKESIFDGDRTMFLKGALTISRFPKMCCVFDSRIRGIIEAHEASMKVIAHVGSEHAYDYNIADIVVEDFSDVNMMEMRRLFGDVTMEDGPEPEPGLQGVMVRAPRRRYALTASMMPEKEDVEEEEEEEEDPFDENWIDEDPNWRENKRKYEEAQDAEPYPM